MERRQGVRTCVACDQDFAFDGSRLTPLGAEAGRDPGADRAEPRRKPKARRKPAGIRFVEPEEIPFEECVAEYHEVFAAEARSDPGRIAAALVEADRPGLAAGFLLETLIEAEERSVLFPDEAPDLEALAGRFEASLEAVGRSVAGALRKDRRIRSRRVELARGRVGAEPERRAPFRAAIGRDLGRLLGVRDFATTNLPAERALPLEAASYRLVEAGEHRIGPPGGPFRRLRLDPFHVRTEPVTVEAFAAFMERTGYPPPPLWAWRGLDRPGAPVVGVTWEDAAAYASHLGGRLPTEAEWVAARGVEAIAGFPPGMVWEILLDDAGDPGGPFGPQGVILLGDDHPKCLRSPERGRRQLQAGSWRADTGFRVVLDPRLA